MRAKKGVKKTRTIRKRKSITKIKIFKSSTSISSWKIAQIFERRKNGEIVGVGAPEFLSAVFEYLTIEVLELTGNAARDNKKIKISPRDNMLAVRKDEELNQLPSNITISSAGVVSHIHKVLFSSKNGESKDTSQEYIFGIFSPVDFYGVQINI
jgi:histone H2A